VIVLEPGDAGSIKIDQVRDVIDRAAYRPFEGRRRVVIVDEADALVAPAQNALLKTLEEPSPSSVFVLVTARPDALLATVRSRCIRLTFSAAAADEGNEEARAVAERVLAQAAATSDPRRRLDAAKELVAGTSGSGAAERDHLAGQLRAMAVVLRDVEALSAGADTAVHASAGGGTLERLVAAFGGGRGVRAFFAVDRALAALDGNASAKIVADWLVFEL
jgi:DNA polymerase-3 subunit delta'